MAVHIGRRGLLAGAAATTFVGLTSIAQPQTSARLGVAGDIAERLDLAYRSGLLDGLHGVLVKRHGETVLEAYFSGTDENWGRPLGDVAFSPTTLHDLRSVTKSITSLVYGIALAQGRVPPPDAPLLDAFPQYADLAVDPARAAWTVGNVLNMTLGTEWNEDVPYTDPANSEIMMERADDRYRFILDRPIVDEPGTRWIYNGGCSAIIGYLIAEGTGQSLEDFASDALFEPLGITDFEWNRGSDGVPSAASGLRLTAPSLARIGQMMLASGQWQGREIVPAAWIDACMTPQIAASFGQMYSNQWYLSEQYVPVASEMRPMISAAGNGGQRLFVMPSLDLTGVIFAGDYNRMDQWINPTLVLQRIVLANITEP